jgi:hypothetical protein
MTLATGVNLIKFFTAVINEGLKKARVFVPGKLFKPVLTNNLAYYEK